MSADHDITAFIRSTFRSVWSLELMLFLLKNRERSWSRADLVAALRGSDSVVGGGLDALLASGLITTEEDGGVRFSPASADLDRQAHAAAELYARSPDAVRRMIVLSANAGINAFADAFRLRKD
jgi:DNA-binding transcriptional ArsR family regulator